MNYFEMLNVPLESQTLELCVEAVKLSPRAMKYIDNQTDLICIECIKVQPQCLYYISNQKKDFIELAISLDSHCKDLVRKAQKFETDFGCTFNEFRRKFNPKKGSKFEVFGSGIILTIVNDFEGIIFGFDHEKCSDLNIGKVSELVYNGCWRIINL